MNLKFMPKISLVLLTALSSQASYAATSVSKPFNGFYAGAMTGFVINSLKGELSAVGLIFKANKTNHVNGFLYGLMAGYGRNLNGFYLGAEISIHSDTTNKNKDYTYNLAGDEGKMKARYQRGPVFSLAPRLGVMFAESYMVYFKPAIEISKDKTTASGEDGDTESSKKKLKSTFVPTLGLEKAFSNVVLARIEYSYNLGSKAKVTDDEGVSHSLKYTSHAIKVGIAYQF
jgi:opacity protein-like surface antigen